ncbi:Antibiotic biosynthesis monooxygenase [Microlunatus soli]|uniref:Antibiotic biosynthesis monooxygenase n=1 Tax=Microlunatus soli TaxID=630515 RepID=A0A1H1YW64_9ACTN|nr:Antibiotic biosynthesis monooxygenase [Microlunatus soli]
MIVISRFRVPPERTEGFVGQARAAIEVLSSADGFRSADLGRNTDEPDLWTITTRWRNVGSYRRGLGSYEAKLTVAPLLSEAVDEPSAYIDPDDLTL